MKHLQRVQNLEDGQQLINLPPSIAISLDGEELRHLHRPPTFRHQAAIETYRPPPNRTIQPGHSEPITLAHWSRSTQNTITSNSPINCAPAIPTALTQDRIDYVSTSFLTNWRQHSIKCEQNKSKSHQSPSHSKTNMMPRHEETKKRSGSADGVRRLFFRCNPLRIGKKLAFKPSNASNTNKPPPLPKKQDKCEAVGDEVLDGDDETPGPWDLPPNYVDMIYCRDTTNNESRFINNSSKSCNLQQ